MPQGQYMQHQPPQQMEGYQPYPPQASNSTNDRVNQLRMYRNSLTERQQQLYREGLLPPQHTSHFGGQQMMHQNYAGYALPNQQDIMDIDYAQNGGLGMQHSNLDPAFVQDLNPADLNPQEFEKYLVIDRKAQATARYM
uniref:Uncharacterized protein n=1 Tax=Panagrolaimus sp. JU765 TaxID=591449 RepID=A0AC34QPI4_9BILA